MLDGLVYTRRRTERYAGWLFVKLTLHCKFSGFEDLKSFLVLPDHPRRSIQKVGFGFGSSDNALDHYLPVYKRLSMLVAKPMEDSQYTMLRSSMT